MISPRAALHVLLALVAVAPGAAAAAPGPRCTRAPSPDGHEPPCNPYAASDWAQPHRNSYEQDSTPYAGPRSASSVTQQHIGLTQGTNPFLQFSGRYRGGRTVVWYSQVATPDAERIGKVDVRTGRLIDSIDKQTVNPGSPSGAYTVLDRRGRFIAGKGQTLKAYVDSVRGNPDSPIRVAKEFTLPAKALCGSDDKFVGLILMFNGQIAFATVNGVVGVIPDDPSRWDAAHVHAVGVNPRSACADSSAPREKVSNSIAADEHGAIYTVTSAAQYKHVWNGRRVRLAWRAPYRSDGYQGGIRLGVGSGSSPTLMGTSRTDPKLVVITDGQKVMHYVAMWRDAIPRGWRGLGGGRSRRVVCDVRVDFGNRSTPAAQSEQSVAVRGFGAVVVNNSLKNTTAFDALPSPQNYTAATLASGNPAIAAHGMERIDFDPRTRRCRVRWANSTVSIPNAIPTISARSSRVYAIGERNGTWGLEGVDFRTGASRLWIPTGMEPAHNSFYADTEILPDGSMWTGTLGAIDVMRPAG